MDATEATTETSPPDTPPGFGEPDPAEDPNRYPYATWSPWAAVGGSVAALILGVMLALPVIWAAGN
ncbi:MAG: hypothetical protein KDB57_09755, partial [Solirubrobacterales bacterium]|nr:hypothetical protein [Solirubrobacterales bacterium]